MAVNPEKILIKDYTYGLPAEKIAQHPLKNRDESKLLIFNNDKISETLFKNLAGYISSDSVMIFNDTRVINARLLFETPAGKQVEIFCLEPADVNDVQLAFAKKENVKWQCIVGNLKAWKSGMLKLKQGEIALLAGLRERLDDTFIINFEWVPENLSFAEILEKLGITPLPPYMKRKPVEEDKTRYQTIYAADNGSVAAPTAGLHFTNAVLESLKSKNIRSEYITLHVGAGTFKPVKSESIIGHSMHSERFYVLKETIENILNNPENIIAVGTTSLRTIESLYWYGVQLHNKTAGEEVFIKQWEPYNVFSDISMKQSFEYIVNHLKEHNLSGVSGRTEIIIVPGYEFRAVRGLITNFHQPQSTLLLLIAAFIGSKWHEVYKYALKNGFRFLSYGDSSLLFRQG